ncbi:hypothetical protein LguiA_003192 [Lonicera macranthoides]
MGRSPCCDESGLKKGPWTPEEDDKLIKHIHKHGHGSWRALPKLAGLNRCGKSCRLRWTNYLRPDIKRGKFSEEEEQTILHLHSILGNKWSAIATHLPGRTDNEIKNFWNTHLKKKLIQMGFDPMTHRPRTDIFSSLPHLIALANLKDLIENQSSWEEQAVRFQNDQAVQMARLQYLQTLLHPPVANTSITDLEAYNLLTSISSIKENPNLLSTPSKYASIDDSVLFTHMPALQAACGYESPTDKCMVQSGEFTVLSQTHSQSLRECSSNSPWLTSTSSQSPPMVVVPPVVVAEGSGTNTGDACSSSSYGGPSPSYWPDLLLEDPLFHEIA